MEKHEIQLKGARAAKQLMLHYLVSDLGHNKNDFLCGISTSENYNNFLRQSSIPVLSKFSIQCSNSEVADVCIGYMKDVGFRVTKQLYEKGGKLVFIFKEPSLGDKEYLQSLSKRIEKSCGELDSLVK